MRVTYFQKFKWSIGPFWTVSKDLFVNGDSYTWQIINFALSLQEREAGQRLNIILVAEGAMDREGHPITAEGIKKASYL